MSLLRFASRPRLAPGLAALVLAAAPANAMIIRAGRTSKETAKLMARSQAIALGWPDVMQIQCTAGSRAKYGTGVFLGLGDDGRVGFVLTAAHCLFIERAAGKSEAEGCTLLLSAPDGRPEHREAIPASRGYLLTTYREPDDGSPDTLPRKLALDDLAVVAFPVDPALRASLDSRGCTGVPLLATGSDGTLEEGLILGYGDYGTHRGRREEHNGIAHAGMTLVSYQKIQGTRGWFHVGQGTVGAGPDGKIQFKHYLNFRDRDLEGVAEGRVLGIRSHRRQAFGAPGDSGGPLIFRTPHGPRVAGILCCSAQLSAPGPRNGPDRPVAITFWTPVQDYLPWIGGVLGGEPGASRILDFTRDPGAGPGVAERKDDGLDAVPAEAQAPRSSAKRKAEAAAMAAMDGAGAGEPADTRPRKRARLEPGEEAEAKGERKDGHPREDPGARAFADDLDAWLETADLPVQEGEAAGFGAAAGREPGPDPFKDAHGGQAMSPWHLRDAPAVPFPD